MIWNDIILRIDLTNEEIQKQLANSFSVGIDQVVVSEAIENVDDFLAVTCIRNRVQGDYNTLLNLYLDFQPSDTFDCLKKISKNLHTDILTSDESTADPYGMLLIGENGEIEKVRFLANKLDDKDEYHLDGKSV